MIAISRVWFERSLIEGGNDDISILQAAGNCCKDLENHLRELFAELFETQSDLLGKMKFKQIKTASMRISKLAVLYDSHV